MKQFWKCEYCGEGIEGSETDSHGHLARQINGHFDETISDSIICNCGEFMDCEWFEHEGEE